MKIVAFLYLTSSLLLCSCWGKSKKQALSDCHKNQVGTYYFDTTNTIEWKDFKMNNKKVENLTITFNSDSTFVTNVAVSFLDDTVGYWNAGTCGFEDWGEISFDKSNHLIQFAPYNPKDSMFCLIGQYREKGEGTQYIWFKKIR